MLENISGAAARARLKIRLRMGVGLRFHEGDNLHLERELFFVVRRGSSAGGRGGGWLQFNVLDAHVGKGILKVRHEPAEVAVASGSTQMKYRRLVRELREHPHFPR